MRRRIRATSGATATLFTAALLLTPTLAAADEDEPNTDEENAPELEVLSEAEGYEDQAVDSTLSLNSLERAQSGETTLLWTVTNHEGELHTTQFRTSQFREYYEIDSGRPVHGVTLLDEESQIRYYPLVDSEMACLCAGGFNPEAFVNLVGTEQSVTYWTTYLLPNDINTVTVEAPGYDPFEGIEVTDIS